jgi:hypothetical protein
MIYTLLFSTPSKVRWRLLVLCVPLCIAACRDSRVATYRIPKENDTPPATRALAAPVAAPGGFQIAAPATSGLVWTAPADWKPKTGSSMRKGSYDVGASEGGAADLAITAFPGDVGGDLANVNRWRGQLALPPISDAELPAALTTLSANGVAMKIADLTGGPADNPQRMLGAIVPHGGATWFFKLTGPAAVVTNAKAAYLDFLQTIKTAAIVAEATPPHAPVAPPAAEMVNTPVIKADGPGLKWTAPSHWQDKPPTAMRKATYVVPGAGGANGEISVTAFPGEVGGELANVNRWRGQFQLPALTAAELPAAVTRLTANGLQIALVDFSSGTTDNPQRLLGAIVPDNGATWFFKFTGPSALVGAERPAFLNFLQSLSAP